MRERPKPNELEPGQESVWDYPRPPRLERVERRLRVVHQGRTVADTGRGWRVLETSHPPNYYFPPEDVDFSLLREVPAHETFCEWKGRARYYDVVIDEVVTPRAAWYYPDPTPEFAEIAGAVAFYAGRVDEAWVGDEKASAQPGKFYGGWVTSEIVGPLKGRPGTGHW